MILFFDTETDGLPKNWNGKITDADNWPRMLSITWALHSEDGAIIEEKKFYIKHPGYKINPDSQAFKVNGITQEMLDGGIEQIEALHLFLNAGEKSKILVAHNFKFDKNIILSEMARIVLTNDEIVETSEEIERKKIDTMLDQKAITGKWPKLNELHRHLFGTDFDGAHDALGDVRACARCYFELKKKNLI